MKQPDPRPIRAAFAALLACSLASLADAQGEPAAAGSWDARLAVVREAYGSQAWPQGVRRDGIPLGSLQLAGYRGEQTEADGDWLARSFSDEHGARAFSVEALVGESVADAHEAVVSWLAGLTSPQPAPRAAQVGLTAGEIAFVGVSASAPRALSWIAFARGNVAVRVLAYEPHSTPRPDLGAIAAAIDALVAARPALATDAALPRPVIGALSAAPGACRAGGSLGLEFRVADAGAGPDSAPTLSWIVGGPGLGYVERGPDGAWRFSGTGPGRVDLTLVAIGSSGTVTTRSIPIDVGS